jgi:hypothetical protein
MIGRGLVRLAALALALLGLLAGCAMSKTEAAAAAPQEIVAVGDIHGDYDAYMAILKLAGLVDAKGRWAGGKTVLVQVGDIPDRGPDTKKIIEHMMALEKQAKRKGGSLVALVGNHEAMNMTGDLRYVTPGEFAAFATRGSARLRETYFKNRFDELAAHYRAKDPALDDAGVRAAFEAEVPLGYLEHRLAWSPEGKFGAWVLQHDAVRVIGETLFVHGGISPAYAALSVDEINARVRAALAAGGGDILTGEDGPLWHRAAADDTAEGEAAVAAALAAFGVRRVVMGHTPSLKGIRALYGGRAVVIDTGASKFYGGARSYLKISGGEAIAVDNGVAAAIVEDLP